jgi:hypothetical protein
MIRDDRPLRYRVRATATGQRLTVYEPGQEQQETSVLEGLEFATVEDLLHFVGTHYPNSKEDM